MNVARHHFTENMFWTLPVYNIRTHCPFNMTLLLRNVQPMKFFITFLLYNMWLSHWSVIFLATCNKMFLIQPCSFLIQPPVCATFCAGPKGWGVKSVSILHSCVASVLLNTNVTFLYRMYTFSIFVWKGKTLLHFTTSYIFSMHSSGVPSQLTYMYVVWDISLYVVGMYNFVSMSKISIVQEGFEKCHHTLRGH